MFDPNENIIHVYPGNIITIAGKKKKIPASFSRPWQARVPYPNPKCPFHRAEEREAALITSSDSDGEEAWFVLNSLFAPEVPHRLIIPANCWNDEEMRSLGGLNKILMGVELAAEQFSRETEEDRRKLWGFSVQIGPLAAQNVPHLHYHLYRPNLYDLVPVHSGKKVSLVPKWISDPKSTLILRDDIVPNEEVVVIADESGFEVVAGGQFTGQLFIRPISQEMSFTDASSVRGLSQLIHKLVELLANKFRSIEGLAPDYRFEFEIWGGNINFGIFVPKLNNTGTLEDMAMIDNRRGVNLLWSHEETARYLRE